MENNKCLYDLTLDRMSSLKRPLGTPQGYQRWLNLLFLHWPIPTELIRAVVPQELELDLFDGQAWVGLVPFEMREVRPRRCPRFLGFNFLETNVRTYVHYQGEPGVYFLSLEAASWIAVKAARIGWGLPYFYAHMKVEESKDERVLLSSVETSHTQGCAHASDFECHYSTRRAHNPSASLNVHYRRGEALGESVLGSPEFFFLERYLLFSKHRGVLKRGQVVHPPYPAHRANVYHLEDHLIESSLLNFTERPSDQLATLLKSPTFIHASPGVDVEIFPLQSVSRS